MVGSAGSDTSECACPQLLVGTPSTEENITQHINYTKWTATLNSVAPNYGLTSCKLTMTGNIIHTVYKQHM